MQQVASIIRMISYKNLYPLLPPIALWQKYITLSNIIDNGFSRGLLPAMMTRLAELVANHEDWLMQQVLAYAKKQGYTRYTSTLAEAWRISIAGISQSLLEALAHQPGVPELLPDEDYTKDPIASFGIIEAQRRLGTDFRLSSRSDRHSR